MNKQLSTLAALVLTFASCATTAAQLEPLTLEANAVTVPGGGRFPGQVLIRARIIDGEEVLVLPRMVLYQGTRATAFVGEIADGGEENGFQVNVEIDGDVATLDAYELRDGKVLRSETHSIPVESDEHVEHVAPAESDS